MGRDNDNGTIYYSCAQVNNFRFFDTEGRSLQKPSDEKFFAAVIKGLKKRTKLDDDDNEWQDQSFCDTDNSIDHCIIVWSAPIMEQLFVEKKKDVQKSKFFSMVP